LPYGGAEENASQPEIQPPAPARVPVPNDRKIHAKR